MIESVAITEWGRAHPWESAEQVEQDLLLSRAICAIAAHDYLGRELIFRGGTAFHKLHLPRPFRYSEDLDYVRQSSGGIGPLTTTLTGLGRDLGFTVSTRISEHPKVYWRTNADSGLPLRIKIEVNTRERAPALPLVTHPFAVESKWWSGSTNVQTFQVTELVATKIRALYQRSKGRDLFDLWLALSLLELDADAILDAFAPYRPRDLTAKQAISNLRAKQGDPQFRSDMVLLATKTPPGYSVDGAAELVIKTLLSRL